MGFANSFEFYVSPSCHSVQYSNTKTQRRHGVHRGSFYQNLRQDNGSISLSLRSGYLPSGCHKLGHPTAPPIGCPVVLVRNISSAACNSSMDMCSVLNGSPLFRRFQRYPSHHTIRHHHHRRWYKVFRSSSKMDDCTASAGRPSVFRISASSQLCSAANIAACT